MRIHDPKPTLRPLIVFGGISWCLYAVFALLSQRFGLETPGVDRPIVAVCGLLGLLFIIYIAALRTAIRLDGHRELLGTILIFAAAFRAMLLLTEPFQEIDLYRYVWDGQTTLCGVSPFKYSPQQVRTAHRDESNSEDLSRLVRLRDRAPAVNTILTRIHFAELQTVYPPTSQVVFALAALTTPNNADVGTHLAIMKSWMILFDLGALWGLIAVLRLVGKPIGWSIAYGWCPLVIKEFANSGHLDSIAVCLTTWAVYFLMRGLFFAESHYTSSRRRWRVLSAATLAFAVGAKLYPVVLVPLFAIATLRKLGWKPVIGSASVFSVIVLILLVPFRSLENREPPSGVQPSSQSQAQVNRTVTHRPADFNLQPPVPEASTKSQPRPASTLDETPTTIDAVPRPRRLQPPVPPVDVDTFNSSERLDTLERMRFSGDPQSGLKAFLTRWKMNDFLFLIAMENLTPTESVSVDKKPWFVVVPERQRVKLVERIRSKFSIREQQVPFVIARVITALAFLVVAVWFAYRQANSIDPQKLLGAVFLTLAWFWLLLPTQNPWYWIWALPFVPFARSRAWLAMSGLSLVYYLRFWFVFHHADNAVWPTRYAGPQFFDFVVVWFEYGPWLLYLMIEVCSRQLRRRPAEKLREHSTEICPEVS